MAVHEDIRYLIALVSLLFKRPPEPVQTQTGDAAESENETPPGQNVQDSDPEDGNGAQPFNEEEFEDEPTAPSQEEALNDLKRKALDRLAEALARFKTQQPYSKKGRPKKDKKTVASNLDAKHVTGIVMVEDEDCVTFICAKNEGLDEVDEAFLGRLRSRLQDISGRGTIEDGDVDLVFELIFDHNAPRLEFYSDIVRRALIQNSPSRTTNSIELRSRSTRPLATIHWEGLDIPLSSNGDKLLNQSETGPDCLSDDEGQAEIRDALEDVQHLFGSSDNNIRSATRMKGFLMKFHRIIKHQRLRPAFKGNLRQILQGHENSFSKAWAALLFMSRTFHAAVTLVELASRVKSFSNIRFIQRTDFIKSEKQNISNTKTPTEILEYFGVTSATRAWRENLLDNDTIRDYHRLLRLRPTIHAEVQLMYYLEADNSDNRPSGDTFPYIGCSKKCCFFCDLLRASHGQFSARGSHETVFPQWSLPAVPLGAIHRTTTSWDVGVQNFQAALINQIQAAVRGAYPLPSRDLLRQSSAALSTQAMVQREIPSFTQRPPESTNMIRPLAVSASDRQVTFVPSASQPGYATLLAPSMSHVDLLLPIEEAQLLKINHDRRRCGFEKLHEMPVKDTSNPASCRRCRAPAANRCGACWTWYCSRKCQRMDWRRHLFTCRVKNRPDATDYLALMIRLIKPLMRGEEPEALQKRVLKLFADDDLCRTFGFNNCFDVMEVIYLISLYDFFLSQSHTAKRILRTQIEQGALEELLLFFSQLQLAVSAAHNVPTHSSVQWYLSRRQDGSFPIKGPSEGSYVMWLAAITKVVDRFDLTEPLEERRPFSLAESEVFRLFVLIQPGPGRLPEPDTSAWINFGFCYCKTFTQREELCLKYLELGDSEATFHEIVHAYETSTLETLMSNHGIDISALTNQGITLNKPRKGEYTVFRLMIGVEHALSGQYCNCFRVREDRECHWYFETHLDVECDSEYGFHLSNSWERWQLLNFYKYVFSLPDCDPRAMAEATLTRLRNGFRIGNPSQIISQGVAELHIRDKYYLYLVAPLSSHRRQRQLTTLRRTAMIASKAATSPPPYTRPTESLSITPRYAGALITVNRAALYGDRIPHPAWVFLHNPIEDTLVAAYPDFHLSLQQSSNGYGDTEKDTPLATIHFHSGSSKTNVNIRGVSFTIRSGMSSSSWKFTIPGAGELCWRKLKAERKKKAKDEGATFNLEDKDGSSLASYRTSGGESVFDREPRIEIYGLPAAVDVEVVVVSCLALIEARRRKKAAEDEDDDEGLIDGVIGAVFG
ncbi:hypothetical protein BJY04DRAFT_222629 [Aspergillus karnatakaensis]|uniref:uncharacterized protein n=1 Tax=Aspergillus karnatakaensis TaxID=1810916 RepID=UPI003CCCA239